MNLIFDTETTGFARNDVPLFHDSQPHIAQLAAVLCDDEGVIHQQLVVLIEPTGWEMPEAAQAVHGHSTEKLEAQGIPILPALSVLMNMGKKATKIIGHNLSYDMQLLKIELARIKKEVPIEFDMMCFCTMKTMTDICRIPKPRGSGWKWPKLTEAYQHCFGKEFEGAHDALADVLATKEIFFWLKEKGLVS